MDLSKKGLTHLWKLWYNYLAKRSDINTMNYGYHPTRKIMKKKTIPTCFDLEVDKNPLCLYEFISRKLRGKVLEVGCGRGGGLYYLAKTNPDITFVGLDYSKQNISKARDKFSAPNLTYINGNSMDLPFEDETFDVVLNVESSHCYDKFEKFVTEVRRVLKPRGIFNYTDFRPDPRECMRKYFKINVHEDISTNVMSSIQEMVVVRNAALEAFFKNRCIMNNKLVRRWIFEFIGSPGGSVYSRIKDGQNAYRYIQCRK